jgi:hypothetical protein
MRIKVKGLLVTMIAAIASTAHSELIFEQSAGIASRSW